MKGAHDAPLFYSVNMKEPNMKEPPVYGVVQNGRIDARTIGPTIRSAMVNILYLNGYQVTNWWSDAQISHYWNILREKTPGLEIRELDISIREDLPSW